MNQAERDESQSNDTLWEVAARHGFSRRTFLALLSSGGTSAVLAACQNTNTSISPSQPQSASLKHSELIYASATTLAKAIRSKQVSSEEVVRAYVERIEAVNPKLNAVVQLTAETALAQARELDSALSRGEIKGPLHGVPFTVKDNIETALKGWQKPNI
jgi:amidase